MNNLEVSLEILKEVLAHEGEEKDILVKAEKILDCFEKIYLKISDMELKSNVSSNAMAKLNLSQLLKQAANNSEKYEDFYQTIQNHIDENPKVFECLDCSKEKADKFQGVFSSKSYGEFRKKVISEVTETAGGCPNGCPRDTVRMAVSNKTFKEFQATLSELL